MKIMICTTPIRPVPTDYPPLGSMAVIQALRLAGYDPFFYDIDALRPSFEEEVKFIKDEAPDIVGISAVVSTAYAYTKQLCLAIKEALPETKIIVGGNLAASSEILLRFCNVDFCVVGEGEIVIVNLIRYLEKHRQRNDYSELQKIKGLAYLDEHEEMVFTGYETQIPAEELFDPDYTILEQFSRIDHFINNPIERIYFARDPRAYEPHRHDKKVGLVITAKGCVARCTFCHRWDRGYRAIPVETIVRRIKYLMERYDVGFIRLGDENFGSDRRHTEELIKQIKALDILYLIGGVRVRSVDLELLKKLKESGCVNIEYGMETGSPRMLQIMEKNATLEQNINAARWTYEAGLNTIYQLVLAMPGETNETIAETADFIKRVTEFIDEPPHERLSVNYIQALPGTPVYEYARVKGLIGRTLEAEEQYLIDISDINASDDTHFINFTEYDYFTVQSWRPKITFDAEAHYYKRRNWRKPSSSGREMDQDYSRGGYFNLQKVITHPLFYRTVYRVRPLFYLYLAAYLLSKDFLRLPFRQFVAYIWEFIYLRFKKRDGLKNAVSLRKVMRDLAPSPATQSEKSMMPLREGR